MQNNQLTLFPNNEWKKVVHHPILEWENRYKMEKVISELEKHDLEILGAAYVSEVDISGIDVNQARADDYDPALVSKIQLEIKMDGLETLPVGFYNSETKLLEIGDGHHRTRAQINISREMGETRAILPFLIVSSSNSHLKKRFLRRGNNHNSSKSNTKADWVKHIVDLINDNDNNLNWRERSKAIESETLSKEEAALEYEKLYTEVKEELTACKCTFAGKPKADIFHRAFKNIKASTIRTIDSKDSKQRSRILFNSSFPEQWNDNKYEFSAGHNAARKATMIALMEWGSMISNGKVDAFSNVIGKINFVTYFTGSYAEYETLQNKRQNFLKCFEDLNKFIIRGTNARVNKIVFEPQYRSKKFSETKYFTYIWNRETLKFELSQE